MQFDVVLQVLTAFEREGVRYKVVGAVAMNLHGLPRATDDLGILVEPKAENIERMKRALNTVFQDPEIDGISADDLLGDYPAVQYNPPQGSFHIDILQRLGEVWGYDDVEVETLDIEGVQVPVATAQAIYEMKKDTVRLQDRADAERLREHFGLAEE